MMVRVTATEAVCVVVPPTLETVMVPVKVPTVSEVGLTVTLTEAGAAPVMGVDVYKRQG